MTTHRFLSDPWFACFAEVRDEFLAARSNPSRSSAAEDTSTTGFDTPTPSAFALNLIVNAIPSGVNSTPTLSLYITEAHGLLQIQRIPPTHELPRASATLESDYDAAQQLLAQSNPDADLQAVAMKAWKDGAVKVRDGMFALLGVFPKLKSALPEEFALRIRDFTTRDVTA